MSMPEQPMNGQPKIGVYVCHCGINISNKVNIEEVVAFAGLLPNVTVAKEYKFMCSDPGQQLIMDDIAAGRINRVVVASCSPLMHEITFRETTARGGENQFHFQMANIREHVSWVTFEQGYATDKAKALISGAVRRVALHSPLKKKQVEVNPDSMVVGGGIAGIHAALTLANSGKKVYLVEREPTIGGHMAQFDKTFPTLDCAACILTPKMTQVRSHPNIELLTYSEVDKVEGYVGNFNVRIRRKPRFISEELCTGCGECAKVCPVEVPSEFDEGLTNRKAVFRPFPQAVPNTFTIARQGTPPCQAACAIHQNAQGYVTLVGEGKFLEAREVILRDNPLPSICGRICTHPCMQACSRSSVDDPLNVPALKRFVMEFCQKEYGDYTLPIPKEERQEKVAIIGSGPSGLMCAYELRQMGFKITIYEALPVVGGMLTVGIPAFRLPREVIKQEIDKLVEIGVDIRLNSPIGSDGIPLEQLRRDYDAVYVAVGAHIERKLNIPGENLSDVWGGIEFLRKVNLGEKVQLSGKFLVIGGGNSALDAARTALRSGATEVTIVYRRTRLEMPADEAEISAAEEEGINIEYLTAPISVTGSKAVSALECQRMQLGEPDESGRRRPEPIPGATFTMPCDGLIITIGQSPDLSGMSVDEELPTTRWNTVLADNATLETSLKGVFAGGDCVTGPDVVINALAGGKKAATTIQRYIDKEDLQVNRENEGSYESTITVDTSGVTMWKQIPVPCISLEQRRTFKEVHQPYNLTEAMEEAKRCLDCGTCCDCQLCASVCEPNAIDYTMKDEYMDVQVGGIVLATGFKTFDPKRIARYGYGRYGNVFTSLEIERMVNASGPTGGQLKTRDGKKPAMVGIVHCVGSRDDNTNSYCSKVCCMYSLKLAHLVRERTGAEVYNFYIDMRTPGKGYEEFYDQLQHEGNHFVRGRVAEVTDSPLHPSEENHLIIRVEDTLVGMVRRIPVDMVILSVGLEPQQDAEDVRRMFNISCSTGGWFMERHPKLAPISTFTDGIVLAGTCQGPKDIPETVAQAGAAASEIMALADVGYVELEPNTAYINEETCSGCKTCIPLCPFSAISFNGDGKSHINEALCKGCGTCVAACPSSAAQQYLFTDEQITEEIKGVLSYV